MSTVKVVLAGVGGAIVAAFLWLVCALVPPLIIPWWLERTAVGIGAVSEGSASILLAALIGFAMGVVWMRRRVRQQPQ